VEPGWELRGRLGGASSSGMKGGGIWIEVRHSTPQWSPAVKRAAVVGCRQTAPEVKGERGSHDILTLRPSLSLLEGCSGPPS
jgi:hypothetical protein